MELTKEKRIQNEELREALELDLSRHFGARRSITKFRRRRSVYSSSAEIENIDLELDRGHRLRLVHKDLSPLSLLSTARMVRPHFLYSPSREIETYRKILQLQQWGTATYYGSVDSNEQGRHWLFLERVNGSLLWQVGLPDTWDDAARWLAHRHVEFQTTNQKPDQNHLSHLLRPDKKLFQVWLSRAEEHIRHSKVPLPVNLLRRFGHLVDGYSHVIHRLQGLPLTFNHGEYFPSNIIVRRNAKGAKICPIDWEVAAIGPATMDLAALTSGNWRDPEKRRMVSAYRKAAEPINGWPPPMSDLMEAVELCQLQLCVQLLGWASDWSPPEQHAQDWLRVACRLADKLGL